MSDAANLRGYLLVTACYWAFTVSDGALRMLVLLHLHEQGQTALALALLLLPYELAGVLTNLLGGFLGARFGLKPPLVAGLLLQAIACAALSIDTGQLTLGYVMATQVLSGIAKDLTKTSAKSYVRVLAPKRQGTGLFRLVAWMTGSKNTMKGLGFFVGGALLSACGFANTNLYLAIALLGSVVLSLALVPTAVGRKTARFANILQHDRITWWLSIARAFLFGSRDAWFAVALPLFLVANQWSSWAVGAFLAVWVMIYGLVQAAAPQLARPAGTRAGTSLLLRYTGLLLLPLAVTAGLVGQDLQALPSLMIGLCLYGALFAMTSSLHSWLVVALHQDDRNSERIGFYYAANAVGRLVGTLLSGWLYAEAANIHTGLVSCLLASCAAVVLATLATAGLRRQLPN